MNEQRESDGEHLAWLIPSRELDTTEVVETLREAGFSVSEKDTTLGLFDTSYEIRGPKATEADSQ